MRTLYDKVIDMGFEEIVQAAREGKYFAKNRYYGDILNAISHDAVLALDSAAEYWDITSGSFGVDVHVYASCSLPEPFVVHLVDGLDWIDFVEVDGLKVTSLNRTINDLLASDDTDQQIVLESLGFYYYDHNKSFDGLVIEEGNKERFEEEKEWAVRYWSR